MSTPTASSTTLDSDFSIPDFATAAGDYRLDTAISALRDQWRKGKQIVVLVGAGISSQSGFPSLGPLGIHLLTLLALKQRKITFPVKFGDSYPSAPAFALRQMGWTSPCLFPEMFGEDPKKLIIDFLVERFKNNKEDPDIIVKITKEDLESRTVVDLQQFASDVLGLSWYNVLDEVAMHDPQLVDDLFDSIGSRIVPGAAHNLLSQFVSWMNVRLLLTTNFDSMIEKSLENEGLSPYVYDVHVEASPPLKHLIQKHLSVIKLHGSHFGIRADNTINTPMDPGQIGTMLDYFEDDAILLVMDYGGGDGRMMAVIKKLLVDKPGVKIIRVDPLATTMWNPFFTLVNSETAYKNRVFNLYYPHSRFFLLDVLQKCSGKLPNTRSGYPIVLQTPVPHKGGDMFGQVPKYEDNKPEQAKTAALVKSRERNLPLVAAGLTDIFSGKKPSSDGVACRFAVVTGGKGSGVSQVLSQVAERLYKSHQLLWCDLDEAVSVGTLVAWLHRFLLSRQPELPDVPLPLELPRFDCESDLGLDSLARTAVALWDRMKRDRYYIVIDSISYALKDMYREKNARQIREAKRLVLFLAMLSWCASRDDKYAYSLLAIGTHILDDDEGSNIINDLRNFFLGDVYTDKSLTFLPDKPSKEEIRRIVDMILAPSDVKDAEFNTYNPALVSSKKVGMDEGIEIYGRYVPCGLGKKFGVTPRFQQRIFIKLPKIEPETKYEHKSNSDNAEKFVTDFLKRDGTNQFQIPDADTSAIQTVPEGVLRKFLEEASLCNRPLSWSQLLALPSVKDFWQPETPLCETPESKILANSAKTGNIDAGTLALHAIIDVCVKSKLLRRQQGGYYYMDGTLRDTLRHKFEAEAKRPSVPSLIDRLEKAHEKILRYYERAYNVSGDITALNYVCYHSWQLYAFANEESKKLLILQQMERILLENSRAARGHLNAYDHAFLFLSLYDGLETIPRPIRADVDVHVDALQKQILKALSDLYESTEDVEGGKALMPKIYSGETAESWHEWQKIHSRNLKLYSSCVAGLLALGIEDSDIHPSLSRDQLCAIAKGEPLALDTPVQVQAILLAVLTRITTNKAEWLEEVRRRPENWSAIHGAILRLVRTVSRLHRYESFVVLLEHAKAAADLLSVGKELLACAAEDDMSRKKLFWTRYHCTDAFSDLYLLGEKYDQVALSTILYKIGMAKSYALRQGGSRGAMYEVVSDLQEAEALTWEGRMLAFKTQWPEAKARQYAVRRILAESQRVLSKNRLALVWWREMTILSCGVTVDLVRSILAEAMYVPAVPAVYETQSIDITRLEESIGLLEGVSIELRFQRPIVWNDAWRETRLAYQMLRLIFYTRGILAIAVKRIGSSDSADKPKLVTIINRALRVMKLAAKDENSLPLLPIEETTEGTQQLIETGIEKVWSEAIKAVSSTAIDNESGLQANSVAKMQEYATKISHILPCCNDLKPWGAASFNRWKGIFTAKRDPLTGRSRKMEGHVMF